MENGYRHIDTAFNYHNEEAIGKSLKKWFDKGGKREELFITSKVISSISHSLEKTIFNFDINTIVISVAWLRQ